MSQTITIRLTPKRAQLLKQFKNMHNLKKNSEAIDLALRLNIEADIDYSARIKKVSGCLGKNDNRTALDAIRSLRNGT